MKTNHIPLALIIALVVLSTFKANAQPQIVPNGPLVFCNGASVTLCVEPAIYSSYLWNNGNTTSCITVTESGDYFPVMLDSTGNIDSTLASQPVTVTIHHAQPYVIIVGDTIFVNQHYESYQWYMNNQIMIGATDSFLVPTITAFYHVEVTDQNGCVGHSYLFEPVPNSIIEQDMIGLYLHVYPNPVNDRIVIESSQEGILGISLFDMLGRERDKFLANGNPRIELNLSDYRDGIYMIEVVLDDGMRGVQRLVVQH